MQKFFHRLQNWVYALSLAAGITALAMQTVAPAQQQTQASGFYRTVLGNIEGNGVV